MSKLYTTPDELFTYLTELYVKEPGPVKVLTYGMYLGITLAKDWASIYPMAARTFIETVKSNLALVVGVPYYLECRPGCPDCATSYNRGLDRHEKTIEQLELTHVRYKSEMHMKMYTVGKVTLLGGINLGSSNAYDCVIKTATTTQLRNMFAEVYFQASKDITPFRR